MLRSLCPASLGGESVTTENTAPANCPPETGATSEAEGVDKSLTAHCPSLIVLPLHSLSLVASDYSSGSAVCFGTLRPFCPLREIKAFLFFHAERKERRDLFSFVFHACAGGVVNFVTTRGRRGFYPVDSFPFYSPSLIKLKQSPFRSLKRRGWIKHL